MSCIFMSVIFSAPVVTPLERLAQQCTDQYINCLAAHPSNRCQPTALNHISHSRPDTPAVQISRWVVFIIYNQSPTAAAQPNTHRLLINPLTSTAGQWRRTGAGDEGEIAALPPHILACRKNTKFEAGDPILRNLLGKKRNFEHPYRLRWKFADVCR